MSGRLRHVPSGTPVLKHEHLRIILDNESELWLHDPRKFGRFILEEDVEGKLLR